MNNNIKPLEKNGKIYFPTTVSDAVLDTSTLRPITGTINRYNLTGIYGRSFTPEEAISVLSSYIPEERIIPGVIVDFINTETGILESWELYKDRIGKTITQISTESWSGLSEQKPGSVLKGYSDYSWFRNTEQPGKTITKNLNLGEITDYYIELRAIYIPGTVSDTTAQFSLSLDPWTPGNTKFTGSTVFQMDSDDGKIFTIKGTSGETVELNEKRWNYIKIHITPSKVDYLVAPWDKPPVFGSYQISFDDNRTRSIILGFKGSKEIVENESSWYIEGMKVYSLNDTTTNTSDPLSASLLLDSWRKINWKDELETLTKRVESDEASVKAAGELEAKERSEKDTSLEKSIEEVSSNLNYEVTRATKKENDLESNITSETSRATTAETGLLGKITDLDKKVDTNNNSLSDRIDVNKTSIDRLKEGKQDNLTFDDTPTENSGNPVKSGGVYSELTKKQNNLVYDDKPIKGSGNIVKSGGIYDYLKTLVFTITNNSTNGLIDFLMTLDGSTILDTSLDFNHKYSYDDLLDLPDRLELTGIKDIKIEDNGTIVIGGKELKPVTDIKMTVPGGLKVDESEVDDKGLKRVDISLLSGYTIPTTTEETNWNSAYTWYASITGTDSDNVINKWKEVVDFLAGLDGSTTLENILATKQDKLTFDDTPTENSGNPVKSGGVYSELSKKQNNLSFDSVPTSGSTNLVKSGDLLTFLNTLKINSSYNSKTGKITLSLAYGNSTIGSWTIDYAHDFASLISHPTTLSGYGITDASINSAGVITLGDKTITPITSISAKGLTENGGLADGYVIPTTTEETNWNSAYTFVSGITSTESTSDGVINKWKEVIDFLVGLDGSKTLSTLLGEKQGNLTFDDTPTKDSANPIKSGGVYSSIDTVTSSINTLSGNLSSEITRATAAEKSLQDSKQNNLTFDTKPTSGSTNPVTSGGLFDYIGSLKASITQDATKGLVNYLMTLDGTSILDTTINFNHTHKFSEITNTPDSLSGFGIKDAYIKNGSIVLGGNTITPITSISATGLTSRGGLASGYVIPTTTEETNWNTAYTWVKSVTTDDTDGIINKWKEIVGFLDGLDGTSTLENILATKQDKLTFDTTPTANSTNPVTSGGIKSAIDSHTHSVTINGKSYTLGNGNTPNLGTYLVSSDLSTYSTTSQMNTAISNALSGLDVSSVGGTGKYISAISETDGKITATATDMPDYLLSSSVSAWAKEKTKPSYTFTELTAHPTTISGYGITDAYIGTDGSIVLGAKTITPLTSHQSLSAYSTTSQMNTAISSAIEALDVTSVGGTGKYIASISETDGKITATSGTLPSYTFEFAQDATNNNLDVNIKNNGTSLVADNLDFSHTHSFYDLTNIPGSLEGYGITNAYNKSTSDKRYKFPIISHGTSDTTYELTSRTYNTWGEVSSLTITLKDDPGYLDVYMFKFTSPSSTATTLTLPSTITWSGGTAPTIGTGKTYIIEIIDNIAKVL